jgi:hypothetical protein
MEKAMVDAGIILLKYWLEVTPKEQERRLRDRINDGRKIWKLSPMDIKSFNLWDEYTARATPCLPPPIPPGRRGLSPVQKIKTRAPEYYFAPADADPYKEIHVEKWNCRNVKLAKSNPQNTPSGMWRSGSEITGIRLAECRLPGIQYCFCWLRLIMTAPTKEILMKYPATPHPTSNRQNRRATPHQTPLTRVSIRSGSFIHSQ